VLRGDVDGPSEPARLKGGSQHYGPDLAVPCPICDAAIGRRCTGRTGKKREPHQERRSAALRLPNYEELERAHYKWFFGVDPPEDEGPIW
jgi:hypothetical protein